MRVTCRSDVSRTAGDKCAGEMCGVSEIRCRSIQISVELVFLSRVSCLPPAACLIYGGMRLLISNCQVGCWRMTTATVCWMHRVY
jgi:hypothetical protein